MDLILKKLERWYNVDITLMTEELKDYTFTATFTDETLQQALHLLSVAVPIEYNLTSRIMQSDNKFSKREVLIYKKNE